MTHSKKRAVLSRVTFVTLRNRGIYLLSTVLRDGSEGRVVEGLYTNVPQWMLRSMCEKNLSGREIVVMLALMHHGIGDGNEVGVTAGGYAMSAADVAEYVGGMSEGNVRRVISSLVRKDVLVRSRRRPVGNGRWVSVHALSDGFVESVSTPVGPSETTSTGITDSSRCEITDSSHTPLRITQEGDNLSRSDNSSSDLLQDDIPRTYNSNSNDRLWNAQGVKEADMSHFETFGETCPDDAAEPLLYYPYPTDVGEVIDYLESVEEIPGYDAALFMMERPENVERFYRRNVERGWVLADGRPTLDWHYAVMSYAVKVASATCPGVRFSVPREQLMAERMASGQGGRW